MVDTKAPATYMHLHLKLKKLQVCITVRPNKDTLIPLMIRCFQTDRSGLTMWTRSDCS